jgi:hypothetical protein
MNRCCGRRWILRRVCLGISPHAGSGSLSSVTPKGPGVFSLRGRSRYWGHGRTAAEADKLEIYKFASKAGSAP